MIIIGAGVAGLSAGCYAQMNGYHTRIYELHRIPGGLCTSWRRGKFVFDGALRYLTGTSPQSKTHQLWQELDLLRDNAIYYYDDFICFEGADGRAFHLYTDIDRLEAHMLKLSPQDREPIRDFIRGLHDFRKMELPVDLTPSDPIEAMQLGQSMMPVLEPVLRWRNVTVLQFSQRFKDPFLREMLPQFLQFSPPDFPMMLLLTTLANMHDREAGYPIGGSLRFAQSLADRYLGLGGEIQTRSRVSEILVAPPLGNSNGADRACGVRLEDGSEHHADVILSAADGHSTIYDMLGGRYLSNAVRSYYRDMPTAKSILQISLGVDRDFSHEPPTISFPLPEPTALAGISHNRLVLKHYCFDPTMAPPGKSVLSLWVEADYKHWKELCADRAAYRAAKDQVANVVIDALERRFPGLSDQVERVDVATPVTYERYTANWRGAFAGWAMTTKKMSMMMGGGMSKTLPGLDNFYMLGQWVEPGGNVELSVASGRDVIKDLCKLEGKPFTTAW